MDHFLKTNKFKRGASYQNMVKSQNIVYYKTSKPGGFAPIRISQGLKPNKLPDLNSNSTSKPDESDVVSGMINFARVSAEDMPSIMPFQAENEFIRQQGVDGGFRNTIYSDPRSTGGDQTKSLKNLKSQQEPWIIGKQMGILEKPKETEHMKYQISYVKRKREEHESSKLVETQKLKSL